MIISPSIELQNGRCVSLNRGRLDEPHIWHVDPLETAKKFAASGAEWIHLTDFDAIAGDDCNTELVQDIIQHCGASIQLGGGFRSLQGISEWIDRGAGRIVIGTLAVMAPGVVKQAAKLYPDQIVIAVDVFEGRLMSDGWRKPSAIDPETFIKTFAKDPLAAIIVTDIDADIEDTENSLALVTNLAGISTAPVYARGLSNSIDDIARLKYVPHVAGAIIGRSLFDHSVDLNDAIALANLPSQTAAFV
jgi:phosphoribosylformimino-5-aminoimidazole carboxamide ribotide isomerase